MPRWTLFVLTLVLASLTASVVEASGTSPAQDGGTRTCRGKVHLNGTSAIAIDITVREVGCPRARVVLQDGIESSHDFECRTVDRTRGLSSHCRKQRPNGTIVGVSFFGPNGVAL